VTAASDFAERVHTSQVLGRLRSAHGVCEVWGPLAQGARKIAEVCSVSRYSRTDWIFPSLTSNRKW
jgi:hypothetical protein